MKRLHLNLLLIAVVAGLGATLYFTQKKEEKGPPLTTLNDSTLTSIRIEHPDKAAVLLLKQDGQWRSTEPVQAATDPFEVASLISLATMEAKHQLPAAEVDLKELGLEPPAYRITLNDQALQFGNQEPINFRRYIRVGEQVALTDDPPAGPLDADYSELVAKELLPANAQIAKIVIPGFTVTRADEDGGWTLSPEQADASSDQKQQLVNAWKTARSMWNALMPEDASGEPVTITLQDGTELELQIAAREPQLIIDHPALRVRYTLSQALEAQLLQLPAAAEEEAPVVDAPPPAETPT